MKSLSSLSKIKTRKLTPISLHHTAYLNIEKTRAEDNYVTLKPWIHEGPKTMGAGIRSDSLKIDHV